MNIYLQGYSIRLLDNDPSWTLERKKNFLIKPEILLPKSVDDNVWQQYKPSSINTTIGLIPQSFWLEQSKMLKTTQYEKTNSNLVELTTYLHTFEDIPEEIIAMDYKPTTLPNHLNFIGYDIADEAPWSGLSNCQYSLDELNYCRQKFGSYLNQHGLFSDINIAQNFIDYTNSRVKEHAPFYLYSLYTDKILN